MGNKRIGFARAINSKSRITNDTSNVLTTTTQEISTTKRKVTTPANNPGLEEILINVFRYLYLLIENLFGLYNLLFKSSWERERRKNIEKLKI